MSGDRVVYAALLCGGVVLVAEPLMIRLLRRLAVLDVPGTRSSHTAPTPRGGGAPIAAGLLVAAALAGGTGDVPFAAAIAFFGVVGMIDDLRGLPAVRRLALQGVGSVAVAALLVSGLDRPPLALAAIA